MAYPPSSPESPEHHKALPGTPDANPDGATPSKVAFSLVSPSIPPCTKDDDEALSICFCEDCTAARANRAIEDGMLITDDAFLGWAVLTTKDAQSGAYQPGVDVALFSCPWPECGDGRVGVTPGTGAMAKYCWKCGGKGRVVSDILKAWIKEHG